MTGAIGPGKPAAAEYDEAAAAILRRRWAAALVSVLLPGALVFSFLRLGKRGDQDPAAIVGPRAVTSAPPPGAAYSRADRELLLGLARLSLETVVREGKLPELPGGLPETLTESRGCFVTLEKHGELRGCIGHMFPKEALARAVIDNARAAAMYDTRFSPVTVAELADIEIEISVLSIPVPLAYDGPEDLKRRLRPHVDGVVLNVGGSRSTFLPQVWDKLPSAESFLSQLSLKAGQARDAWRDPSATVLTYQAEAFSEEGP